MHGDMDFTPDGGEFESSFNVEFKPAKTPEDFREKAQTLVSNAMDLLNAKIRDGMAEASDIKTALEFGKHFKVGIETVDEAAERARREAERYLEPDTDDDDLGSWGANDSMRFEG